MKIYEAAGNDVATAFFRARRIVIGRSMSLVASTEYWRRAWLEHQQIAEAIRAGAADDAAALAGRHTDDAAAWLVEHAIRTGETADSAPA
jgi:DNA-binding FadR family transcriptional regulator